MMQLLSLSVIFFVVILTNVASRQFPSATNHFKRNSQSNTIAASDENAASASLEQDDAQGEWVKLKTPSEHIAARVGSDLELICEAIGSPPPKITWYRGDMPLEESSVGGAFTIPEWSSGNYGAGVLGKTIARLPLPCISSGDYSTIYSCMATAGVKSSSSTSRFRIIPHSLKNAGENVNPECLQNTNPNQVPRITMYNPTVIQEIGGDVMFRCDTQTDPHPNYQWLGPNGKQVHGSRFKMLKSGTLIITSITWADMGGYTCIIENMFGSDTANTFLYPLNIDVLEN